MINWDKWEEIIGSIRRHKVRTALTGIAVAWGIFMLVMLLGMSQGLQNGIAHSFEGDAINSIWLFPGRTSKPYEGLKEGRRMQFTNEDYDFLKEQFPEISELSGEYSLGGERLVKYKQLALSFQVRAMHPEGRVVENIVIEKGRWLSEEDQQKRRKVGVIGQIMKDKLFPNEEAIGKEVIVDGVNYKIVGVYSDKEGEFSMRRIYLPIATAQQVYSANEKLNRMFLAAGDLSVEEMADLENGIRKALAKRKKYDVTDRRAIYINNFSENFKEFQSLMFAIKSLMWIVGVFSIVAGVIGVSNIMLIIVKDRTKEIGIRKAIGATPSSIVGMIFQESIFITAISGYIGLAAGVGVMALMKGIESEFFRQPEIDITIAIIATLILIMAGGLAGLLPALQAARINPVKAIKSE
ncbi:MAG: putative ABC transport system permease protein [Saprospiraceae bacterium]|jgi:putative ABC transport system permease protein